MKKTEFLIKSLFLITTFSALAEECPAPETIALIRNSDDTVSVIAPEGYSRDPQDGPLKKVGEVTFVGAWLGSAVFTFPFAFSKASVQCSYLVDGERVFSPLEADFQLSKYPTSYFGSFYVFGNKWYTFGDTKVCGYGYNRPPLRSTTDCYFYQLSLTSS